MAISSRASFLQLGPAINTSWKVSVGDGFECKIGSGASGGNRGSQRVWRRKKPRAMLRIVGTYPIQGLSFFWKKENREILWRRAGGFAAEVGASSLAIVGSLFGFTFSAQRSVVSSVVPHVFGTPGTVALILMETSIPIVLVFSQRLRRVQEKLFMDVLGIQGVTVQRATPDELGFIADQRMVHQRYDAQNPSTARGFWQILTDPQVGNDHPFRKYLLTLPFNFIPVAGQILFCYVNALESGTNLHHYYYKHLKKLSSQDEATLVRVRQLEYRQFGLVASAMTLVPGANICTVLSNAVGAALWAAELEKDLEKKV